MRLLAVLVNYGKEQLCYLQHVVKELNSFAGYDVDVIVNTNVPVRLANVKQRIIKIKDNQLLPLTCRQTIWDNRNDYDVFYYGENDHLLLEHHVDNHLKYEELLPKDRISGLLQYEENDEGMSFPAAHARYDWDFSSTEIHGGLRFAHFTNLHQACFILSRDQLLRIGELHDFTKFMGQSHYSTKCRVNTDIYQFTGMKKVICIDDIAGNMIHHLPNLYINGDNGRHKFGRDQKWLEESITKLKNL